MLNEGGHDVFPRRRERGIHIRGHDAICPQLFGNFTEFRDVVTALRELERRHKGEEGTLGRSPMQRHSSNTRLFAQDKIHFRAGTIHLDRSNSVAKIIGQLTRLHEPEKRPLRIGVRKNDASFELRPILQEDAASAATIHVNTSDGARREDFDAQLSAGRCKGLRDRAHSSHHVAVETLGLAIATAQQMKDQTEGGPCVVRSAVLAVDIIGEKHRLDFVGFIVPIEKIAQAAGKKRNELTDLLRGHPAKTISHAQQFPPAFRPAKRWIRRRLQKKWLQIACEPFELVIYAQKRFRIARRNLAKFLHSAFTIRPPSHYLSIWKRNS